MLRKSRHTECYHVKRRSHVKKHKANTDIAVNDLAGINKAAMINIGSIRHIQVKRCACCGIINFNNIQVNFIFMPKITVKIELFDKMLMISAGVALLHMGAGQKGGDVHIKKSAPIDQRFQINCNLAFLIFGNRSNAFTKHTGKLLQCDLL